MAKQRPKKKEISPKSFRIAKRDFSCKAISKAATRSALSFWGFQYPAALCAGSVLFGGIVGLNEPVFWTGIVSLLAAGIAFTWKRFFREAEFEHEYVKKLRDEIEAETGEKRQRLAADLRAQNCPEGARQLEQFQSDFNSLVELLTVKIDPSELTHQRYRGMAEEVFLSGIDNLRRILAALMSVDEINVDEIQARIVSLDREPASPERNQEIEVLKRRLDLKKEQGEKVRQLLVENEKAITRLEETAALIADMDTGQNEGKIDMENSMKELMHIVERARKRNDLKEMVQQVQ